MLKRQAALGTKPRGGPGQRAGQEAPRNKHIAPDITGGLRLPQHLQPDSFVHIAQGQHLGLAFGRQRAPFVHQHRHGLTTAPHDRLQFAADQRQHAFAHVRRVFKGCTHHRGVVVNGFLHHRTQDLVLALEVMKDAAGLDTHGAGQVAHGGAFKAFVAKQVSRGLQQLAPGTVGVGQLAAIDHGAHHPLGFVLIHAALLHFY